MASAKNVVDDIGEFRRKIVIFTKGDETDKKEFKSVENLQN